MANTNRRQLSLKPTDIVVIASVILVIGLTYFFGPSQAKTLQAKVAEVNAKQQKFDEVKTKYNNLVDIANSLPQQTEPIRLLSIAYPKDQQVVEIMIQLQTIIERVGLTIVDLIPGTSTTGSVPIALTVKGNYDAVKALLGELARNLRPVVVKSYNISGDIEKPTNPLTANLSLLMPYNSEATGEAVKPVVSPSPQAPPSGKEL